MKNVNIYTANMQICKNANIQILQTLLADEVARGNKKLQK
jgi:hypothetical protein